MTICVLCAVEAMSPAALPRDDGANPCAIWAAALAGDITPGTALALSG